MPFPVTRERIFFAHAGVAPLPQCALDAITEAALAGTRDQQEGEGLFRKCLETRSIAARLIGAEADEIALIGPTALGLNLVANGLAWQPGDEVIYYADDYPANVYPWLALADKGVKPVPLHPPVMGHLTPEFVLGHVTPRTRLVALASCHFLTGYRVDVKTIGAELRKRGILFCLDAIQSLGATEIASDDVDFLSADSHKWLLGPLGAGIFYVKKSHWDTLRPTLLGSWNVQSPRFIAQAEIRWENSARRYEPGSLNLLGILGMRASMELLLEAGIPAIQTRLLELHALLADGLREGGFMVLSDRFPAGAKSGIVTCSHPGRDLAALYARLLENKVSASMRWDRAGQAYLRFSPHYYNTGEEVARALKILLST